MNEQKLDEILKRTISKVRGGCNIDGDIYVEKWCMGSRAEKTNSSSEIRKYKIPLQNLKSSFTFSQQNERRYGG